MVRWDYVLVSNLWCRRPDTTDLIPSIGCLTPTPKFELQQKIIDSDWRSQGVSATLGESLL